jgi:signal transduction histidine kinase
VNPGTRAIIFFAACVIHLLVAGFLVWHHGKRKLARVFALNAFFVAGYVWFAGWIAAAPDPAWAALWMRLFFPLVPLAVITTFHFALTYSAQMTGVWKGLLRAGYAVAIAIGIAKLANLFPFSLAPDPLEGWRPEHDSLIFGIYIPFMGLTFSLTGLALLSKYFRSKSRLERSHLRYFFAAVLSMVVLTFSNLYPPLSFVGPFDTLAYTFILAYAVSRRRLFELNPVIGRGAVASAFVFLGSLSFFFVLLWLSGRLPVPAGLSTNLVGALALAVLASLLFDPFRKTLASFVRRRLRVKTLSTSERLLEYLVLAQENPRFQDYLRALCSKLKEDFGLQRALVLLSERVTGRQVMRAAAPADFLVESSSLPAESALVGILPRFPGGLDLEEMLSSLDSPAHGLSSDDREGAVAELKALGGQVALPVLDQERLEGILLLGPKQSGALFNRDELVFLAALSHAIASGLQQSRLSEKLQQSDKLSTLGLMASSVAHEVRNPLTSVSLFVKTLQDRFHDESFRDKFTQVVIPEVERIQKLTDDLLAFSRPAGMHYEQVDLNQVAEGLKSLLNYQFLNKHVELEVRPWDGSAPVVVGSSSQLFQVLMNLLLNALEATRERGKVVLKVSWLEKDWIEASVEDTGSGIPEGMRAQIFEPFFTTKERGTGLGLATSQRVVAEHGGQIRVDSELGHGSRFVVRLPATVNGMPASDQWKRKLADRLKQEKEMEKGSGAGEQG